MTTYLVTVPGTLHTALTDQARSAVVRALVPADPRQTEPGAAEGLDLLSVNDGGTFSLRLEVEADDKKAAGAEATRLAGDALEGAGLTGEAAQLGPPVITGIAVD